MHDIDVSHEGRELSTIVVSCLFCNNQRPSPYFYSYVYVNARTFSRTFTKKIANMKMSFVSLNNSTVALK